MTRDQELKTLCDRFDSLSRDLERVPARKLSAAWVKAALAERERVRRQIDTLEDNPPVPSYNPADDDLYAGMEDEADEPTPPPPAASAPRPRHFEPDQADVQSYCEMSERGAFRPFDQIRPKQNPAMRRTGGARRSSLTAAPSLDKRKRARTVAPVRGPDLTPELHEQESPPWYCLATHQATRSPPRISSLTF